MARRIRRRFRGGRVVDVAGGHGLLAWLLLVLDDSSPDALVVDPSPPPSNATLARTLTEGWPRLAGRVQVVAEPLDTVTVTAADLVASCHACGTLTDRILDRAASARARVAVLPCCHDFESCDAGDLTGWLDGALAIDVTRVHRLRTQGYRVWTQTIPATITPKNRLLLGEPTRF